MSIASGRRMCHLKGISFSSNHDAIILKIVKLVKGYDDLNLSKISGEIRIF